MGLFIGIGYTLLVVDYIGLRHGLLSVNYYVPGLQCGRRFPGMTGVSIIFLSTTGTTSRGTIRRPNSRHGS